ncbi:KpsF/GutQ family sugar-phosphate isomerase [Sphingopyxis panaciterrae]
MDSATHRTDTLSLQADDDVHDMLSPAKKVVRSHIAALEQLLDCLNEDLAKLAIRIATCRGRVIVTGIGKSGIAARKIAASLAARDVAATFMHGADALHGDLGMVRAGDILIAISISGASAELLYIVRHARSIGAETVAITAVPDEVVPAACDHIIPIPALDTACDFGVAPFSSTISSIAIGDALTLLVAREIAFSHNQFARLHPAGRIGRRFTPVRDLMCTGDSVPTAGPDAPIDQVIAEASRTGAGACVIIDEGRRLLGIVTDGDIRRHYAGRADEAARTIMSADPVKVTEDSDQHEAFAIMRGHRISIMPVVAADGEALVGLLNIQDMLQAGYPDR